MEPGITTSDVYIRHKQQLSSVSQDIKGTHGGLSEKRKKTQMLNSRLAQTLPLDKSQIGALHVVLGELCHTIGLLAGGTILALLHDPSTDISLIVRIKRYGKRLFVRAGSEAEHEVATVIYLAAIASALVYHDVVITKSSYRKLVVFFSCFTKEKWIPRDLSDLLRVARKCCRARAKSQP